MNGFVVCVMLIVIIGTVIGAIAQMVKNAQPPGGAANRPRGGGGGVRSSSNDIDRFLEEIDRLRKKKADGGDPPVAKPVKARAKPTAVPVAEPVPARSTRRIEATPAPTGPAFTPTVVQIRELPAANPVVSTAETPQTPQTPRALHRQGDAPAAPRGGSRVTVRQRVAPKTEFGRGLTALLSNPQSAAMAVVLQEVLGPPKCKQG
jgi:hypothetical protein